MIYPDDDLDACNPIREPGDQEYEDYLEDQGDRDVHRLQEEGYLKTNVSIETALMRRGLDRMEDE